MPIWAEAGAPEAAAIVDPTTQREPDRRFPHARIAGIVTRQEHPTVGTKFGIPHAARMNGQREKPFAGQGIPNVSFAAGIARDEPLSVGTESGGIHLLIMAKLTDEPAGIGIP
jgi:hypothetical protein